MDEEYSVIAGIDVAYGKDTLICRRPEIYINITAPVISGNLVKMPYDIKAVGPEGLKEIGFYNLQGEFGKSGATPATSEETIEKMVKSIIETTPGNAKKLIEDNRPCIYPQTVTC